MWVMNREDHLGVSSSVENVVSNPDDCLFCFVVFGFFLVSARGRTSGLRICTVPVRSALVRFGWTTVAVVVRLARTGCGT